MAPQVSHDKKHDDFRLVQNCPGSDSPWLVRSGTAIDGGLKYRKISSVSQLTALALLAAIGIALHSLEALFPAPVPFLKIGLANVTSLVALMVFGTSEMLLVVVIRVVVGSLIIGSLFSPAFLIGLSGGVVSALMMALVKKSVGDRVSVIGISLVGSASHILTQLLLVLLLFVKNEALLYLLPLLLLSALVGGLIVGFVSFKIIPVVRKFQESPAR